LAKLANMASMTTATTGTGTITLGTANSGFQSFSAAGVSDGDSVRYTIQDGDAWEMGTGVYTSSGTTLTRNVEESSTGSAISLSGTADVFLSPSYKDFLETQKGTISSSGNVDCSTGNFFELSVSLNPTNITFSNVPSSGAAYACMIKLTGAGSITTVGYDVANASYDNKAVNPISATRTMDFKPDGTRMFTCSFSDDKIRQFDLSTAWDISTATQVGIMSSVLPTGGTPLGILFKPDGTKLWVSDNSGDDYTEFTLGTAWDITSTMTQVGYCYGLDSTPVGMVWNNNGTQVALSGATSDYIRVYSCSTAYTVGNNSANLLLRFSLSLSGQNPGGMALNDTGTKLYVVIDPSAEYIRIYDLSTAWDLETLSTTYTQISADSLGASLAYLNDIRFNSDGTKMYLGVYNSGVLQYSSGGSTFVSYTVNWPASVNWPGGVAPDSPALNQVNLYVLYTVDGGTNWYASLVGEDMS